MSIRVTCAGCHTRFDVSEKFAGKEGPCPKCKKPIKIPAKTEDVKVHTPQEFGPKTVSGEAVFKPIARKETRLSPVQLVLIAATIAGFLIVAFMLRSSVTDKDSFNSWALVAGAVVLAIPCVCAGYAFLRNSELGAFTGQELWGRVGACAVAYGVGWLAIPLISYAVGPEIGRFIGVGLMVILGACVAWLFLSIDFFMGILHYGLFFGCCVLLRVVAGFSPLPFPESSSSKMDDILNASGPTVFLETTVEFCRFLV